MLIDGINLTDTSAISNLIVASGTTPPVGSPGELFYRTDLSAMYVSNGTSWVPIDGPSISFADLNVKPACLVATTANITLSGLQTIDGVAVSAGARVLVKNQSAGAQNGIYVVSSGAWTRADDFDGVPVVQPGDFTFVTSGTVHGDTGWVLTTDGTIQIGTTALNFQQFTGANAVPGGSNFNLQINNAGVFGGIANGTAGQVLTSNGNAAPTWQTSTAGAAAAGTLTGTALASNVVSSSLTSVGTLTSLSVNGSVSIGGVLSLGNGAFPSTYPAIIRPPATAGTTPGMDITLQAGNNTQFNTYSSSGGSVYISGGIAVYTPGGNPGGSIILSTAGAGSSSVTERFRILPNGAWSVGSNGTTYGTAGQVLTSNGYAPPTWQTFAPGVAASSLTGTTLASNVTASSLTSVGTLTGLAISGTLSGPANGGTLTIAATTAATAKGGSIVINAGSNSPGSTGAGGDITITAGTNCWTGWGTGGNAYLQGGYGGYGGTAGGNAVISGGYGFNDTGNSRFSLGGNSIIQGGQGGLGGGNVLINGGLSYSTGNAGGYVAISTGATNTLTERFRITKEGAWSVGSTGTAIGTAGQVLTSNGYAPPTWQTVPVPAAAASSLTGTALASNVVSSSLTSVGALISLAVTGSVTLGSATTSAVISGANNPSGQAQNLQLNAGIGSNGGGGGVSISGGDSATTVGGDVFINGGGGPSGGGSLFIRTKVSNGAGVDRLRITKNGEWQLGAEQDGGANGQVLRTNGANTAPTWSSAIGAPAPATTATTGFVQVPVMAGTPTGAPSVVTGYAPMVVDSSGSKVWFYVGGAWKSATLA